MKLVTLLGIVNCDVYLSNPSRVEHFVLSKKLAITSRISKISIEYKKSIRSSDSGLSSSSICSFGILNVLEVMVKRSFQK